MTQTEADIYSQLLKYLPNAERTNWSKQLLKQAELHYVVLAARFAHDVRVGGFALLLHNLNGQMLAEMEDMLLHAQANFAHEYYIQAIRASLFHPQDYQDLLHTLNTEPESGPEECALAQHLRELSQNYWRANFPLEVEAQVFLQTCLEQSGEPSSPRSKRQKLFSKQLR